MEGILSEVFVKESTIWSGESWGNGHPTGHRDVILNASYDTARFGSFTCNNLYINSGALKITANCFIKVLGTAVAQNEKATFTVEDLGELILLNKDVDVSSVKVTFKRIIHGVQLLDYWFLSSPISGKPILQLSPKTLTNRFYTYGEAVNNYVALNPSTTLLTQGMGYMIRVPNNAPTTVHDWNIAIDNLSGGGTLNHGVIKVPITNNGGGSNMVSNPYSAKLNLKKFFDLNKDIIKPYIWVWHKTNNTENPSFVLINKVAATRDSWNINLLPLQGFFIQKTNPGDGEVTFTPDMQIHNENFSEPDQFYLNLVQVGLNIPVTSICYSIRKYPDQFENRMNNQAFTFQYNGSAYSLLQVPTWNIEDEIQLTIKPGNTAYYSIALSSFTGLFNENALLLVDMELGVIHDLKAAPYPVSLVKETVYEKRFKIKFR